MCHRQTCWSRAIQRANESCTVSESARRTRCRRSSAIPPRIQCGTVSSDRPPTIGVPSIGAGPPPPRFLKICRRAPQFWKKFIFTVRSCHPPISCSPLGTARVASRSYHCVNGTWFAQSNHIIWGGCRTLFYHCGGSRWHATTGWQVELHLLLRNETQLVHNGVHQYGWAFIKYCI